MCQHLTITLTGFSLGVPFTNADQGAVAYWTQYDAPAYTSTTGPQYPGGVTTTKLVNVANGSPGSPVSVNAALNNIVLQHADGTFVGTATDANGNSQLVRFDVSGNSTWSKSEGATSTINPLYALADGSTVYQNLDNYNNIVQKVTVDASGNEVSRVTDGQLVRSWISNTYSDPQLSLQSTQQPFFDLSSSYSAVPEGNPSSGATFIAATGQSEGLQIWALSGAPKCALGTDQPSLSGEALDAYNTAKEELIQGGYLNSAACEGFFQKINRSAYLDQLRLAITDQLPRPYDGLLSDISEYSAGLWTPDMTLLSTFDKVKASPVCWRFNAYRDKLLAEAQTEPPSIGLNNTDVYINTHLYKKITQGMIVHEALHNVTGLQDHQDQPGVLDLKQVLGIPSTPGPTDDINRALEDAGCAAKPN